MSIVQLPNAELVRMVEKMANEISNLKSATSVKDEQILKLTWALEIARDEASVNAKLLANKTPALRIVDDFECPVYVLTFATDAQEQDELTQVIGGK
mgnify:FL=1